ncbi:MAG TPA: hypothetical protein VHO06_09750 [Polyangia bacterium]|nr:hypothetical protein [Polyangia bacterium]
MEADLASVNGLDTLNGLAVHNGLVVNNGLVINNGLSLSSGLASGTGLMTTSEGRTQVAYLVRCALPANVSIVKQDQNGASYTFSGLIGLAPQWATGACDQTCQENVSACMLAHVNTAGVHIPLWIVSPNSAIGWGLDPSYPNQEATFFGNIFSLGAHGTDPSTSPAYYCAGPQVRVNPPTGRLGSAQVDPPYTDAFGSQYALCASHCTMADSPYQTDGYKACAGWNNPVTVWRQNGNPTTTGTGGTAGGTGGTGGSSGATGGTSGTRTPPTPPLPPPPGHGLRDLDLW